MINCVFNYYIIESTGDCVKEKSINRGYAFTRSDLLLDSSDWSSLIVGMISRDLNLESTCQSVRRIAEERLKRELNFSVHLGLAAILLPLNKPNNSNLSRIIYTYLMKGGNCQIWVRVPLSSQSKTRSTNGTCVQNSLKSSDKVSTCITNGRDICKDDKLLSNEESNKDSNLVPDTWEWWDIFRGCANTEKRLFLALSLDKDGTDELRLERWLGEPVKAIILSTSLFLTNKRGCPVLPRAVQSVIKRFIPLKVQYIIEGRNKGHDMQLYQQYMDHLVDQYYKETTVDPLKNFASGTIDSSKVISYQAMV